MTDRKYKVRGIPKSLVVRWDIDGIPKGLDKEISKLARANAMSKKETIIRLLNQAIDEGLGVE